jgi:peroxiredoxin
MYRWNAGEMVYFGPHGLTDWKSVSGGDTWRQEGGALSSNRYDAILSGAPGLPEKGLIEIELSWKEKADFVLELGVDSTTRRLEGAFRLEVWDNELVLVGESKRDADLLSLQRVPAGQGKAHVRIYLDQKEKRAIALSNTGQALGAIHIDDRQAKVLSGVRLTNKSGDVSFDALHVYRWNGAAPPSSETDRARLHRQDGSVIYGKLKSYDSKTGRLTMVADSGKDLAIDHKQIADIILNPVGAASAPAADRKLRVHFRDGSRISGTVLQFGDRMLKYRCPDVQESLSVAVPELHTLVRIVEEKLPERETAEGRQGVLKIDDSRIAGWLRKSASGHLSWKSDFALEPCTLAREAAGAIVYREPSPPPPPVSTRNGRPVMPQRAQRGGFGAFLSDLFGADPEPQAPVVGRKSLHLRSGDVIPCEVSAIDERGVTFHSPLATTDFAANSKIKSVELVPTREMPKIDEAKRDRLLTLPRLQKDSPPTHLICSTNGDFLRGRILSMNDQTLKVEIRLETREIPRSRVAQIIWLHADELSGAKTPAAPAKSPAGMRVQIMRADGNRLTFTLQDSDAKKIAGVSEVLGACHANLNEVDQVLFGRAIEDSASKLAYNLWKLRNAAEPRYVQASAGGDGTGEMVDGKSSPLVGQAAFPFKLPMLDGPEYDLAAHKGKIVVLDFWATWCGPCMQTAPLFEEVMSRFAGRDVELIGVNMEERPEQIKSIMQRHKLNFRVALDQDGAIASRYAVTAIPQTVVIGRDGKIVRLFVGGGKKTAEALEKTIQELLAAKP